MTVRLPLFPLGTVLFPHMPATLHVFEPRYRRMMRDCEEQGTSFGIVAIRQGPEVGGTALPHSVGTLAQIRDSQRLADGGYNLVVTGASRFRIDELFLDRSYLVGRVSYLEDVRGDEEGIPALVKRVTVAFHAYADALRRLRHPGRWGDLGELPDDAELLSYVVAASLDVDQAQRQQLLEEDAASKRLQGCLRALRRELVFLERSLARTEQGVVPVSLN